MRAPADAPLTLEEIRAEMTERGQLEFELAVAKAVNRKLEAKVARLEQASATVETAPAT